MNRISLFLLFVLAFGFTSCEEEDSIYDGPNIAYFNNKGIIRDEISENNRTITFEVVSPLATDYDREYRVTRNIGNTLDENAYNLLDKNIIIKAGEYSGKGRIEFDTEKLSQQVDTLSLGLVPNHGKIASFDNVLRLMVSKRCDFIPEQYVGEYEFTSSIFGKSSINRLVEVLKDADGRTVPNAILIRNLYAGGADIEMYMNYDDPTKVTPVVKRQRGGYVNTQNGNLQFWVHTTEQYSYPKLPKSPNKSYVYTCSGEFNFYITFGVFIDNGDGTQKEGFLVGSPSLEKLEKVISPYSMQNNFVPGDDMEIRGVVENF